MAIRDRKKLVQGVVMVVAFAHMRIIIDSVYNETT